MRVPGQGAQYPRMGYSLIQQYPSVRKTFEQLQLALDKLPTPPMWCLKGRAWAVTYARSRKTYTNVLW